MCDQELSAALRQAGPEDRRWYLGCGYEHHCTTHGCAAARAAAERLKALRTELDILRTRREPDPPLTLADLGRMDGEPVWVESAAADGRIFARWMLVERASQDFDLYLLRPARSTTQAYTGESYGRTWLAYRRRPGGLSLTPAGAAVPAWVEHLQARFSRLA